MFKIESNMIIYSDGNNEYSFPAHAEQARPSLMGLGVSAGGRHWSSRDPEIKLEKHTSVQEAVASDYYIAWYIQEFVPFELDYKITKNAKIFLGDLRTGEEQVIYKGECYGDLCFYKNELFFNMGNKLAVFNLDSKETTVLFKHSGIKKNGLELHITDRRIFYIHWTHSDSSFMWYDRDTNEIINPHIYGGFIYYLTDESIIYHGLSHTWLFDVVTRKKKRFFNGKDMKNICRIICEAMGIPTYPYEFRFEEKLENYDGERLYFQCQSNFNTDNEKRWGSGDAEAAASSGLPIRIIADFSCLPDGTGIRVEADISNLEVTIDKNNLKTFQLLNKKE